MNRDEASKKSEEALRELASALKQGKSDTLLKYLDTVSRFHQYSFANCILIAIQRPDATFVAGFQRWKQLGRFVKKNEKGIAILAPLMKKRSEADDEGEQSPDAGRRTLRGFKVAHVFDIAQTEGKELPAFATLSGDPGEKIDRLMEIIRERGISLEVVDSLGGANGCSMGGTIRIVGSLPPPQKLSTLVHELAHELLHQGDRRQTTTKAVRETEAEAVAYVVRENGGARKRREILSHSAGTMTEPLPLEVVGQTSGRPYCVIPEHCSGNPRCVPFAERSRYGPDQRLC